MYSILYGANSNRDKGKNMVLWPKMVHFGHYLLKVSSGAKFQLGAVWPCKGLSNEVYHYTMVALVTEINVKNMVFWPKMAHFGHFLLKASSGAIFQLGAVGPCKNKSNDV